MIQRPHMRSNFIYRFVDHCIESKLHSDFFVVTAEAQHDIRRFFHQKRSGNLSFIRFFKILYLFRFCWKKAHLPVQA